MRPLAGSVAVLALLVPVLAGCGGSSREDYCAAVKDHQEELTRIVTSNAKNAMLQALPAFEDLQSKAPADITDEWQQVVRSIKGLQQALDDAGVDPTTYDRAKPPAGLTAAERQAIDDAAKRLGSGETLQALKDLDQQARDVCHTPLSL